MIRFAPRGILLDIEGTTSSIRFVYDVMFPLVRQELDGYLDSHWGEEELAEACEQIARDAGCQSLEQAVERAGGGDSRPWVRGQVLRLMDDDVKATGLKQLQGQIWRDGFESGRLKAHLYDDVRPALLRWREAGLDVRIYSSGSVEAQRLFFGHTELGDLLPLLNGHYDTRIGGKREPASYTAIAEQFGRPAGELLFVSDVAAELDAAAAAGLQTALCQRPGNPAPPAGHGHPPVSSFDEIEVA